MSGPLSSTQDLTTLGWSVPRIIEKLNPHRGYTICHDEDIMVNKFIAAIDKRWMYNVMKGPVIPLGDVVTDSVSQTSTAWRYDNTENSYPFTTTWNQTWTETTSATLSVAAAASIELGVSITVPFVGGSEFAITIGSESTKSETKETSTTISNSWEFIVGPGETLSVERTIVTTNGKSIYEQEYGFQGEICTNGEPYQGVNVWYYDVDRYLDNPRGKMSLSGISYATSYNFKLIRTTPDNQKITTSLPLPSKTTKSIVEKLKGEANGI